MKTLILIILMTILLNVVALGQFKVNDPHGYLNHATAGVFVGAGSKVITYKFLIKRTNLTVKQCKIISWFISSGSGFLAGHMFESWQMKNGGFYSKNDMLFAGGGGVIGSTGVSLIFNFKGSVPLSRAHDIEFVENDN